MLYAAGAILIGMAAAVVSGMFGIGGAAVTTPSIRVLLGASPGIALGTPLPVTIPTALSGAVTYHRRGLVDTRLAALCGLGGVVGACGGALLTRIVDLHYLMLVTGGIVLYLAGVTVYRGKTRHFTAPVAEPEPETVTAEPEPEGTVGTEGGVSVPIALLIGALGGFTSGLLGIGGGIVFTPCFLYLAHLPIKKSFGTSLAVITVTAVPGTVIHAMLGHVSWLLVLYLVIGAVPGAYIGARLSIRAREPLLYLLFGSLLGVFGLLFIVNEIISMVS